MEKNEVVFVESFENAFFKELVAPSKDLMKIIHKNMTFTTKFKKYEQIRNGII